VAEPRKSGPLVYSIAAHRGFADALVAGLVPRYREDGFGLARLTLLVPSSRAARTFSEAFIRHAGENGEGGLLMPRTISIWMRNLVRFSTRSALAIFRQPAIRCGAG
jgi:ATP-dependent helicase/nuclease subunit B